MLCLLARDLVFLSEQVGERDSKADRDREGRREGVRRTPNGTVKAGDGVAGSKVHRERAQRPSAAAEWVSLERVTVGGGRRGQSAVRVALGQKRSQVGDMAGLKE